MYRTTEQVMQEMLDSHKSFTGVELSPGDTSREEVIKMYPFAAAISSMSASIQEAKNARHPDTSSEKDLELHLRSRNLPARFQPQPSEGSVQLISPIDGVVFPKDAEIQRNSDGAIYISQQEGIVSGGTVTCLFQSKNNGQEFNLDKTGQEFTLLTSVPGFESTATNSTIFANGRDLESGSEMLKRCKDHDRKLNTGGNISAYEAWGHESDPSVVSSKGIKHARGTNTVDLVITSGTTDIDSAVRSGDSITRLPSASLLTKVKAYVDTKRPTTDDFVAKAPTEENFDTTILYALHSQDDKSKVIKEIELIWKIFVYSAKPSDVISPTTLEKLIDQSIGKYLSFRRVQDFDANHSFKVGNDRILNPNTLALTEVTLD